MSVINTNITSMIGQQNLKESQNALSTSMERLSSGLRINSAKDDAAGQAIANRMSSQITGLGQAQRNANDGISMAQTAEGGLNQINDNLQRVRELTVQAQNGTNSKSDLDSIQGEINQRMEEINRISEETDFNGTKVLQEDNALKIQVGANDGETISINLEKINTETLSMGGFNVNGVGEKNGAASVQDLQANGFTADATENNKYNNTGFNSGSTVEDVFKNLEDGGTISGGGGKYTFNADSNSFTFDQTDAAVAGIGADLTPSAGEESEVVVKLGTEERNVTITSTGTLKDSAGETLYLTGSGGEQNLSTTNTSGSVATIDDLMTELAARDGSSEPGSLSTSDGTVYSTSTTAASGSAVDIKGGEMSYDDVLSTVSGAAASDGVYQFDLDGSGTTSADQYSFKSGDGANNGITAGTASGGAEIYTSGFAGDDSLSQTADASVYVNDNGKITDGAANEIYVNEQGKVTTNEVSSSTATEDPLAALDGALNKVDELRSDLGAIQNRFESAITNLSTNETNLSAARSRIEDADYATEVANMTRSQILQQAGTSVLAQANQIPQNVLSLLG